MAWNLDMTTLQFTYWEAVEGGYLGYLNEFPEQWTQGETLDELKEMLVSLYSDLRGGGIPGVRRTGVLEVA